MSVLTARQRMGKKKFISPEDTAFGGKVSHDDPDIERVRRGHLNDMENILPFFVIGFLYVFVNPAPFLAVNLYRLFTAARVVHTIVYTVVVIPQPSRAIAFFVGYTITVYMGLQVIFKFL
ncbi:hypothetical protein L9F63_008090 [Diploptera punctata]|uniref:Microsomal glutathione S-transferase 1 n=1 Tax=Diploptera punctata TaxID=6984 RepID=A0AAD8E295_DIPPU|nr:hypothetical protein L9F63_008090 [Diploptera punctata]